MLVLMDERGWKSLGNLKMDPCSKPAWPYAPWLLDDMSMEKHVRPIRTCCSGSLHV